MPYLFTSESVSEGHPDKIADQISDALLDEFLRKDPNSKVAIETLVTTGLVVLSGEVKTETYVDVQKVTREVIRKIGYTKAEYMFDADSCGIISCIHEQSPDINRGVEQKQPLEQGAGDQGMMFGYATKETENYMPLPLYLSHLLVKELANIRKEGKNMLYLRPDSKAQVTIEYNNAHQAVKIDTIVLSTQHDEFADETTMQNTIKRDVINILLPRVKEQLNNSLVSLFTNDLKMYINPTGKFVIGGPHGDTGLTGRKIIIDTYGGKGAHGGGAFSGKDPSKVDRSAAYAARHIAKNMVAAGIADEVLVQVAYAIGIAKPVGMFINTYNTCKIKDKNGKILTDEQIANTINEIFDMRPYAIIERFGLKNPIYSETAAYGHMGRTPESKTITIFKNGKEITTKADFFAWEKLDYVENLKKAFNSL